MKKLALPIVVVLVVGAGTAFYFLRDPGEAALKSNNQEQTVPDGMTAQDSVPFGDPPSPDELEREQKLKEHARPGDFIEVQFEARKNILGETVAEGTLKNKAELTAYRDLQLMLYFEDELGEPLDSASQVIFEKILPDGETKFKIKQKGPRKSKGLNIRVHDAVVEDPS
ncbi:MAG: hypothetical protein AAGN35_09215 [Bacteroidota bacterium]